MLPLLIKNVDLDNPLVQAIIRNADNHLCLLGSEKAVVQNVGVCMVS
jgi:hypothetical protein